MISKKKIIPVLLASVLISLITVWSLWGKGDDNDTSANRTEGARFSQESSERKNSPEDKNESQESIIVRLDRRKWDSAGLKLEKVTSPELDQGVWVTGKLALNEDRLAHIFPLVDGVVREVRVRMGQSVQAGEVLAVIDSREVGQAKLELVQNRQAVRFAEIKALRAKDIHDNTLRLIDALNRHVPLLEINETFQNQSMGDFREQLVSSYARLTQTQADFERLSELREKQITIEKDFIKAKADFESARATYQATLEQVKYQCGQQLMSAEQLLQESRTAQSVSESLLMILGVNKDAIASMDPLGEGDRVAYCTIHSPFAGTVIAKDIVLSEHVSSDMQLFQLADLSSLWLHADIFEKDLQVLGDLEGKKIPFRAPGLPGRELEGTVFYSGDSVDEKTRAVHLYALVDNAENHLRPGMFVEVKIPGKGNASGVKVPDAAISHDAGKDYIYVHVGEDQFEARAVIISRKVDGWVIIANGLKGDETIVVAGNLALKSERNRESLAE